MLTCDTCGDEFPAGDAHHFDAAGHVWHEECDAPEVFEAAPAPEVCEACD